MHYKESNGNDHLAGCTSLQEIMNFTYTVIKPPDGQYNMEPFNLMAHGVEWGSC